MVGDQCRHRARQTAETDQYRRGHLGVDFGLLDKQGHLIGNPVNYRDPRIEGMMEAVSTRVPKGDVFAKTGIQFMPINTLYQMMSLVEDKSPQLDIAATLFDRS